MHNNYFVLNFTGGLKDVDQNFSFKTNYDNDNKW